MAASVLCNFTCNFSMTKSCHYQQVASSWIFLVVRIVWVDNCLSVFDHFVKLALKGLKSETRYHLETYYLIFPLMSMRYQQQSINISEIIWNFITNVYLNLKNVPSNHTLLKPILNPSNLWPNILKTNGDGVYFISLVPGAQ